MEQDLKRPFYILFSEDPAGFSDKYGEWLEQTGFGRRDVVMALQAKGISLGGPIGPEMTLTVLEEIVREYVQQKQMTAAAEREVGADSLGRIRSSRVASPDSLTYSPVINPDNGISNDPLLEL